MRGIPIVVSMVLAFVAIAGLPNEALAKCGSGSSVLPGIVLIVDGGVDGEYLGQSQAELPLDSEEIGAKELTCHWVTSEDGTRRSRQQAIVVLSKSGYAEVLESFLREMIPAQEALHAALGRYANSVSELGPYGLSVELPADLAVSDSGWSAITKVRRLEIGCEISVMADNAAGVVAGGGEWTPRCFAMPDPPQQPSVINIRGFTPMRFGAGAPPL